MRDLVPTIVLEGSGIRTKLQKIKTVALPRIRCPVNVRSRQVKAYRIAAWMEHVIVWSACFRRRLFAGAFREGNTTVGARKADSRERNTTVSTWEVDTFLWFAFVRRAVAQEVGVWDQMLRNSRGPDDWESFRVWYVEVFPAVESMVERSCERKRRTDEDRRLHWSRPTFELGVEKITGRKSRSLQSMA